MKIYHYHKEQFLYATIEEAWDFFSLPDNLDKITPPQVKFKTITDLGDARLYNGMKIKYRLRPLLNIPMTWETVIMEVDAPRRFIDKQIKGPYALWEHTHTFKEVKGGVIMTDDVKYALPFGWLGTVFHPMVVKKKLEGIFKFREEATA